MLSFKVGDETLRPFSDSCLITSRVPEKYQALSTKIRQGNRNQERIHQCQLHIYNYKKIGSY